jgi:hypothetical protein
VGQVKVKRRTSAFWALLYRARIVRAHMPFWRVVVEAKLNRRIGKKWPKDMEGAVTAVFVWARTIEEAEGLAALALEEEGLDALTADAVKCPPSAPPKRKAMATTRTELGFLPRLDGDARMDGPSHRGARA